MALPDPLPAWDGPPIDGTSDPFALHLDTTGSEATSRDVSEVAGATATSPLGPMTELATAAQAVADATELVLLAHAHGRFSDTGVARMNESIVALGDALHAHAGVRQPSDDRAIVAALRSARSVADQLGQFGHRNKHESGLRQRLAMVERLAAVAEDAPSRLALDQSELVEQVERSLRQLERAREQAAPWQEVDLAELAVAIEKTTEWHTTLTASGSSPREAEKLALAVSEQQELLFSAAGELDHVIEGPSLPTTGLVVAAYVHAMAKSTGRHTVAQTLLKRAQSEKQRQAVHLTADVLEDDESTVAQLGQLDKSAGDAARREHRATERQRKRLDKRILAGELLDGLQLNEMLTESREHSFLHRMQLFELQLQQFASALSKSNEGAVAWVANRFEVDIHVLPGELRAFAKVPAAFRASYKERIVAAKDKLDNGEYVSPRVERERMLAARTNALDLLEEDARKWLATKEFDRRLAQAGSELDDAETRLIITNILAAVALTVTGNIAASAARGAAEGVVLARASRLGVAGADAAQAARVAGAAAGFTADVAVNTLGQKLVMGDQGSMVTLLTLNIASPLVLGQIQKRFRALDRAKVLGTANASMWEKAKHGGGLVIRGGVEVSVEMVAGAALDYAVRKLYDQKAVALTDQEAQDWLLQGAAMGLGRHIAGRAGATMERIQTATRDHGHYLSGRAQELGRLAKQVEASGDVEQATEMLGEYKDLLEAEHAFLEAELAKHADGAGTIDTDLLATMIKSNNRAGHGLAKLGFEEMALRGGGLTPTNAGGTAWEGTSDQVADMLAHARKLGLDVATAEYETAEKRWRVALGDRSFEVADLGTKGRRGSSPATEVGTHVQELDALLQSDSSAFEHRYAELQMSLAPEQRTALQDELRKRRVELVSEQPSAGVHTQEMIEQHVRRMTVLRAIGEFDAQGFHGSGSDIFPGLTRAQGELLPAAELERRGSRPATGEGDSFTATAGPKDTVSIGHGGSGLGTSAAYADAAGTLDHYNPKRLTLAELDAQSERLTRIVDAYDQVVVMDPAYRLERDHFSSRLDRLLRERARRDALPVGAPGREGGKSAVDDYPVIFEFETAGMTMEHRADAKAGDVFGGEAAVKAAIDLRTRIRRVYVPAARIADAVVATRTVVGHDRFEVIALEALVQAPVSPDMISSHRKGLDQLRTNEKWFNAVVGAYDEAAATGKYVDEDLFWEHWK